MGTIKCENIFKGHGTVIGVWDSGWHLAVTRKQALKLWVRSPTEDDRGSEGVTQPRVGEWWKEWV